MDRKSLPYRKNCEGYFIKNGLVLARLRETYIQFPGGGVDLVEKPSEALVRETREETGIIITNLQHIRTIYFDWSPDWAQTEKQKKRYKQFRGEEMHLFSGTILSEEEPTDLEDAWTGEKWLSISKAIKAISLFPVDAELIEYRKAQVDCLQSFLNS